MILKVPVDPASIRARRIWYGFSKTRLAQKTPYTRAELSNMEKGRSVDTPIAGARLLAKALGAKDVRDILEPGSAQWIEIFEAAPDFGGRIKNRRLAKKLTQKQLGAKMYLSQRGVARYERNEAWSIRLEMVKRFWEETT